MLSFSIYSFLIKFYKQTYFENQDVTHNAKALNSTQGDGTVCFYQYPYFIP